MEQEHRISHALHRATDILTSPIQSLREKRQEMQPEMNESHGFRAKVRDVLEMGLIIGLPYIALVAVNDITDGAIARRLAELSSNGLLP